MNAERKIDLILFGVEDIVQFLYNKVFIKFLFIFEKDILKIISLFVILQTFSRRKNSSSFYDSTCFD